MRQKKTRKFHGIQHIYRWRRTSCWGTSCRRSCTSRRSCSSWRSCPSWTRSPTSTSLHCMASCCPFWLHWWWRFRRYCHFDRLRWWPSRSTNCHRWRMHCWRRMPILHFHQGRNELRWRPSRCRHRFRRRNCQRLCCLQMWPSQRLSTRRQISVSEIINCKRSTHWHAGPDSRPFENRVSVFLSRTPYIWAAFQSIIVVTYINLACGRINSDFNTFKTLSILIYVEIKFTKKILALSMSSIWFK